MPAVAVPPNVYVTSTSVVLVPPVRVTVNSAAAPSVTVLASAATLTSIGSSSSMVPVAVAVPRFTPAGSPEPGAARVTMKVSFPSARMSSKVITEIVRVSDSPETKVTVPPDTAV